MVFSRHVVRPTLVAGGSLLGANYLANKYFERRLHKLIEERDRDWLGTDIWIGRCSLNLLRGRVSLHDVRMTNPPDRKHLFKHEDMVTMREIVFDLEMIRLLFSQKLEIEELTFRDVKIFVDCEDVWGPDLFFGKSNIGYILDHLKQPDPEHVKELQAEQEEAIRENRPVKQTDAEKAADQQTRMQRTQSKERSKRRAAGELTPAEQAEEERWIVIREMGFFNVTAELRGAVVVLPEIYFDDFDKDGMKLSEVLVLVMETLARSTKANSANILTSMWKKRQGGCCPDGHAHASFE